jgi:hypothetical protein
LRDEPFDELRDDDFPDLERPEVDFFEPEDLDDDFFEEDVFFADDDFFEPDFFEPEDFEDDFFDAPFEEADFVRPSSERCLFTVAAAICFALPVDRPRFFALSLMCSYCRSSLLLQALGIAAPPAPANARDLRG